MQFNCACKHNKKRKVKKTALQRESKQKSFAMTHACGQGKIGPSWKKKKKIQTGNDFHRPTHNSSI